MPSYTLTYFNGRGRCEIARLLFAVAGVKYEDKRIEFSDWQQRKAKTPFGVLPRLQVGEKSIAMSPAIANFLAREFGFYGKNNCENTRIDTVTSALVDVMDLFYKYAFAEEAAKKDVMEKLSAKVENYGAALEIFLKDNQGGDGYFVGNGLTLADIAFFNAYSEITSIKTDAFDKTPKLKALMDRVAANDKIAKLVKARPQTQF